MVYGFIQYKPIKVNTNNIIIFKNMFLVQKDMSS